MRLVPCRERDRRHGQVGMAQVPSGALHSQPAMQLERCLADHSAKDTVEMKWGQRRTACDRLEIERAIEIQSDLLDRFLYRDFVEGPCFRLHRRPIYPPWMAAA
jgi:hypothetical protein